MNAFSDFADAYSPVFRRFLYICLQNHHSEYSQEREREDEKFPMFVHAAAVCEDAGAVAQLWP